MEEMIYYTEQQHKSIIPAVRCSAENIPSEGPWKSCATPGTISLHSHSNCQSTYNKLHLYTRQI